MAANAVKPGAQEGLMNCSYLTWCDNAGDVVLNLHRREKQISGSSNVFAFMHLWFWDFLIGLWRLFAEGNVFHQQKNLAVIIATELFCRVSHCSIEYSLIVITL